MTNEEILNTILNYRHEAEEARHDRIAQNELNYDSYNLRQDYSDKQEGQSREFLPKVSMAVEQDANFLQQGLVDLANFFRTEAAAGINPDMLPISPGEVDLLLQRELKKSLFLNFMGDTLKTGLLSSMMIVRVGGKYKPKNTYDVQVKMNNNTNKVSRKLVKKENKYWCLDLGSVRFQDYYFDPTGQNLYEMEDIYLDWHRVNQMAEENPGMYDKTVIEDLKAVSYYSEGSDHQFDRNREANQNTYNPGYRKTIKLTVFWGNIINNEGELIFENVTCTIANDQYVLQKPTPNPLWHGSSPYIAAPIISVPNNPAGRALMDAPTMLNRAANEMFNLMLDGGMMAVHGIKQLNPAWLEDPSQVDNGIPAGTTLLTNASCPPGAAVLQRVDTSTIPTDGFTMFNLLNNEFYASALTNDLRMGVAPFRQVKATEVVEASQNINSMFSGMAKQIEEQFVDPLLYKCWATIAQHLNDMDSAEVQALLGDKAYNRIKNLTNEELFAGTVEGMKFRVYGISENLAKQREFTKLQAMLQTIATSPVLMQDFSQKYDMSKLLTEILRSLDINTYKLQNDQQAQPVEQQPPQPPPQQGTPDMQSQIPQAGAAANQESAAPQSAIPQTSFPASRATPRQ